jgi:hypothetical protein
MAKTGKLLLSLVDVNGRRIQESVDVELRHRVMADRRRSRVDARKLIRFSRLHGVPKGNYSLHIDPPSYLPVARFINIQASGDTPVEVVFPVDPRKIKNVTFPAYETLATDVQRLLEGSTGVLGFAGTDGGALYAALDDIRKAGMLNIIAKSKATGLPNEKTVFEYVQEVTELRGDRLFAVVSHELREEVRNATMTGLFDTAPDGLHHPPEGFDRAGSFKTNDRYGNLQLTFFASGDQWRCDIDIDDAKGIEHVFQVVRNAFSGPTHPFNIHQILIAHQQLDPGYWFAV